MIRGQLFNLLSVRVPFSSSPAFDSGRIIYEHVDRFPFMYWPDGRPCELVNMYLLSVAYSTTGDSLKTYASLLSHLVRYCFKNNVSIFDLSDGHFFDFSELLQKEKCKSDKNRSVRNKNTVISIFRRVIHFLFWCQKNFVLVSAQPLIGTIEQSPRIIVELIRSGAISKRSKVIFGGCGYWHRAMPVSESREPKRPISIELIEGIESLVDTMSLPNRQFHTSLHISSALSPLKLARLEYIKSRRHFMIWLMKRTGLRPSEMIEISVELHLKILHAKAIYIPTKKRRREIAPLRSFPITLKDAATFQRYLTARDKYLGVLLQHNYEGSSNDALFLTTDGRPIQKVSLESDFKRLVIAAGYQDHQACFSMFRHRFITLEVMVHLKEFMKGAGKSRRLMTDSDYESILKRVAVKTGHKSVQSLWHYIDIVWGEIDVWGGVDRAIARLHAADRLHDELLALMLELRTREESPDVEKTLKDVVNKLQTILRSAKQDIDTDETV